MISSIVPATEENILRASLLLHQGSLCAFPTETVYGLGGNALSEISIKRIYELKGRPPSNPLIIHVSNRGDASQVATNFSEEAELLASTFWPGPLTLVLQKQPQISPLVTAGLPTVAIRVPAHPIARRLLEVCKLPICAPSANRSESLSPTTAKHVYQSLPETPMILDAGPCQLGIESTVLDMTVSPPKLLRPGALSLLEIRKILPKVTVPPLTISLGTEFARPSPGMMYRHYAPRASLYLIESLKQIDLMHFTQPIGCIIRSDVELKEVPYLLIERLPNDPKLYAADLYAALHRLDDRRVQSILVECPPKTEPWQAVLDRLYRASHKNGTMTSP